MVHSDSRRADLVDLRAPKLYLLGWAHTSRRSLDKSRSLLCCLSDNLSKLSDQELSLWFRSTTPSSEEQEWFTRALHRSLVRRKSASDLLVELLPVIGNLSSDKHLLISLDELDVTPEDLIRWIVKAFQRQLCMGDKHYHRKVSTEALASLK